MTYCTCDGIPQTSCNCRSHYLLVPLFYTIHQKSTIIVLYIIYFCIQNLDKTQEENLKLKELKAQLGQPLYWSDYLSLSFTQSVSYIKLDKDTRKINTSH